MIRYDIVHHSPEKQERLKVDYTAGFYGIMVLPQERSDWQGRPYALAAQEGSDWQGASRTIKLANTECNGVIL